MISIFKWRSKRGEEQVTDETNTEDTEAAEATEAVAEARTAATIQPTDIPVVEVVRGPNGDEVLIDKANVAAARTAMAEGRPVRLTGLDGPQRIKRVRGNGAVSVAEVEPAET